MESTNKFESVVKQIMQNLPDEAIKSREGFEKNIRAALQGALVKMDLVTRDEFDVQAELLARTRALVTELQQRIESMEQAAKK